MVQNDNRLLTTVTTRATQQPQLGSRVVGAAAGALAGAILPIPFVGPVAGAIVGGVFGPRIGVVNKASDAAVSKLGQWAGRR
ncbi:MAG: hypothetical protein LBB58_03475 [Cellulomonadaceae bacterium]|jgi:uncharacterized membrane protein|nr:hypothetical protein [Cellulomonadaceae bacterium]